MYHGVRNSLSCTEGVFKGNLSRSPYLTFQAPPPSEASPPFPASQNYPKIPILWQTHPLPNMPSPADIPGRGQIQRLAPARTLGPGLQEECAARQSLPLAAAPPPLRVAGRPGGRDNVAGLIAGRRPPSHLKWVPPGCCLAGRQGDRGGGEALPAGSALPEAARIPPFSEPRARESRVLGPGTRFQPQGFSL